MLLFDFLLFYKFNDFEIAKIEIKRLGVPLLSSFIYAFSKACVSSSYTLSWRR
jgi:hypothetical protein